MTADEIDTLGDILQVLYTVESRTQYLQAVDLLRDFHRTAIAGWQLANKPRCEFQKGSMEIH